MKEKIKDFFQNEKAKNLMKKLFNKKTFRAAIIIIVLATVLRIGFSLIFEVNGVVRKVDGTNITVANFLTTQTINIGDYPMGNSKIAVGDRIKIMKDIKGQVLSVRDESARVGYGNKNLGKGKNVRGKNRFNNGHENARGKDMQKGMEKDKE